MVFMPGPVFCNILLADEINRTPPKTQSALLEAMQEHHVTVQGKTYTLEEPFFVFATQNPIELEGTYPLPEAQLDRFMFDVVIDYLSEEREMEVVARHHLDRGRPLRAHRLRRRPQGVPAPGAAGAGLGRRAAVRAAHGAHEPAARPGRARVRHQVGRLRRQRARRAVPRSWAARRAR